MSSPALDDLSVYRDRPGLYSEHYDYYTVHSWLTRGRCAEVTVSRSNPESISVRPFLIPSYMQGITDSLIRQAVRVFIHSQQEVKAS